MTHRHEPLPPDAYPPGPEGGIIDGILGAFLVSGVFCVGALIYWLIWG